MPLSKSAEQLAVVAEYRHRITSMPPPNTREHLRDPPAAPERPRWSGERDCQIGFQIGLERLILVIPAKGKKGKRFTLKWLIRAIDVAYRVNTASISKTSPWVIYT